MFLKLCGDLFIYVDLQGIMLVPNKVLQIGDLGILIGVLGILISNVSMKIVEIDLQFIFQGKVICP